MKKLIIATCIAAAMSAAHAGSFCNAVHDTGVQIMKKRQQGVSEVRLARIANQMPDPASRQFVRALIDAAYDQPRYPTQRQRQMAVKRFGTLARLVCVSGGNS